MKLAELAKNDYLKILAYGPSGAGKTCFPAALGGKIEWWDFDHKISTLSNHYKNKPELLENIDVYQFASLEPVKRIPLLEERMKKIEECRRKNLPLHFDTLVVDSLTTLTEQIMEDYQIRSQLGIKRAIKDIPAIQDYQLLDKHLTQLVTGLLGLNANIIMLGHLDVTKDETTGAILRQPLMKGKFAAKLPIYFEEVYVFKVDNTGKRVIQTQPDNTYPICRTQRGLAKEVPMDINFIKQGNKA